MVLTTMVQQKIREDHSCINNTHENDAIELAR